MITEGQITAGMEVIEVLRWRRQGKLVKVEKITPSGQIVLTNGNRYNAKGLGPRTHDRFGDRGHIKIATEEERKDIIHHENIEFMESCKFERLDADVVARLVEIVQSAQATKEEAQ